jgi:multisubunit Na+/H+ antiporter MnhG subunit
MDDESSLILFLLAFLTVNASLAFFRHPSTHKHTRSVIFSVLSLVLGDAMSIITNTSQSIKK